MATEFRFGFEHGVKSFRLALEGNAELFDQAAELAQAQTSGVNVKLKKRIFAISSGDNNDAAKWLSVKWLRRQRERP